MRAPADRRPTPDTDGPPAADRRLRPLVAPAVLAIVVGVMAALMLASHRSGHWWGDDWALYIRQSKSLLDGNPGEITADNHFTVEHSLGAAFSPPLYPWGFPIMMAPFVAVVGVDVDRLAIVQVLCACAFACAWFALARRRLGPIVAFVGMGAATLTPLLFSWTELIQSEWPFLAVTFAMLAALDRAVESQVLTDTAARWWPVVALGVGAAAAFTVRREGLAMTAAIAGAQLALLTTGAPTARRAVSDGRLLARLIVPHASALATVLVLQVTLPSTLVPQYSGTSIRNTFRFWDRHVRNLADVSGLKRPWNRDAVVLGSDLLGDLAVAAYLLAALAGIVLALWLHRRRDLHLAVYALVAFAIGGSFRSAINRYMATVGPVLFLLGLVALHSIPGGRRVRVGTAAALLAATAILAGDLANAHLRIEAASEFADDDSIEWGPTHPLAIEMFDVVEANSDPGDVVAGPKARALTLVTGRRAIQVDPWRPLPPDWNPELVVAETGSVVETQLRADLQDRYREIWRNSRFTVFEALDATTPPG
jgi:Dolichyl-phosphate-mannose-protein mannosyltransferase